MCRIAPHPVRNCRASPRTQDIAAVLALGSFCMSAVDVMEESAMKSAMKILTAAARAVTVLAVAASTGSADPLTCNMSGYKASPGLTASVADNTMTVTWDGDKSQEVRLRFAIDAGTPTIRDLAIRRKGSAVGDAGEQRDGRLPRGLRRQAHEQSADQPAARSRRRADPGDRRQVPLGSVLGRAARSRRAEWSRRKSAARGRRRQSAGTAA